MRSAVALGAVAALTAACDSTPLVAPTQSTLTLVVAAAVLPAGGETTVTATVVEAAGTPVHDGTVVTFSATLGTVYPDEAATVRGRATATFTAGNASGVATVRAYSGDAISEPVEVTVGAAAVAAVRLAARPASLPPEGGTTELTAAAFDADQNPVPNVRVDFTATAGRLRESVAVTDGRGTARTSLSTTTAAEVTAAVGDAEATVAVTVETATAITIAPSPAAPVAGQPVSFAVTIDSAARAITSAAIAFGDGTTAELGAAGAATVTHTYRAAGAYTVTVTARDTAERVTTASIGLHVAPAPGITVALTAEPAAPTAHQAVTFTVRVSPAADAPAVREVTIEFGDGEVASLGGLAGTATVAHVYERAGNYVAEATVEDALGRSSSSSIAVQVAPAPSIPVRVSASPAAPVAGRPVTFTVEVSPPNGAPAVREVTVEFGDGEMASLGALTGTATVAHIYGAAGSYIVTVTVEDAGGRQHAASVGITVSE